MLKKILFLMIITSFLIGCSGLNINNDLPNLKIVLEKNPSKKVFYAATYRSVGQSLYKKDIEIIPLKDGNNKISLDSSADMYAIYFIIPHSSLNVKPNNWKYIIYPNKRNNFYISPSKNITFEKNKLI